MGRIRDAALAVAAVAAVLAIATAPVLSAPDARAAQGEESLLAGRKTVTVSAGSATEAVATAERQNPGWKAVSAEKVAPKDPNSRFWSVVMEK
jgi:hypothetical protein